MSARQLQKQRWAAVACSVFAIGYSLLLWLTQANSLWIDPNESTTHLFRLIFIGVVIASVSVWAAILLKSKLPLIPAWPVVFLLGVLTLLGVMSIGMFLFPLTGAIASAVVLIQTELPERELKAAASE